MRFGVIFPQIEFGTDPSAIRDYAKTAEDLSTIILALDPGFSIQARHFYHADPHINPHAALGEQ